MARQSLFTVYSITYSNTTQLRYSVKNIIYKHIFCVKLISLRLTSTQTESKISLNTKKLAKSLKPFLRNHFHRYFYRPLSYQDYVYALSVNVFPSPYNLAFLKRFVKKHFSRSRLGINWSYRVPSLSRFYSVILFRLTSQQNHSSCYKNNSR